VPTLAMRIKKSVAGYIARFYRQYYEQYVSALDGVE
jgi:ribosomal protein S17E